MATSEAFLDEVYKNAVEAEVNKRSTTLSNLADNARDYQREISATYVSLSIMKSVRCMMYLILAAKQISLCTFHPFPEKNSLKSNMSQSICGSHTGMLQIHTSQTVLSLWIRFML